MYVPDDLDSRLMAVQRDPASQSVVVCRYVIDGHAIQISQVRSYMWVMIKPRVEGDFKVSNPDEVRRIFAEFFTKGREMAELRSRQEQEKDFFRIYIPDPSGEQSIATRANWWGWHVWYSDGDAIAVLLRKRWQKQTHPISTDEPWF
ncbi:MAG: hypothetical protein U1E27_12560 [Kiritimatiellia bacterium]|nr:hypothetical protein [Kiritimatiellia bacterium]